MTAMPELAVLSRSVNIIDFAATNSLRVGLVVGRPAEEDLGVLHCGVRDYAGCLAQALRAIGVEARLIAPRSWGEIVDMSIFVPALRAARLDVLHLQIRRSVNAPRCYRISEA